MTLFILSGNAQALTGNKIDQCYDCHGSTGDNRPLDAAYRNITTGAFKGNHQKHMASTATAQSCTVCHNNSGYTVDHRNGKISFQANINNSPTAGTYSKGVFFNSTSNPVLGTCSSVNCHFQMTTPTWGGTAYQYTSFSNNDCNDCHGAPSAYPAPQDGSHPGTGSRHALYYGTDTASCAKCHADHTAETAKFSHATSAGNRNLILNGTAMTSANYSLPANLVYPAYMTNAAGVRNGNCTNLYCHSDGTKTTGFNPPNQTATWGGTGSCVLCHKADVASGAAITTPAAGYGHTKHVNAGIASPIGCVKCHAATVSNNSTISSYVDHVDSSVTIKFNNTTTAVNGTYNGVNASTAAYKKVVNTTPGACQNVYCHSNGTTATTPFKTMSTAKWGSPLTARANNCASCHGGDATNPRFRNMSTGKHWKHLVGYNYRYACSDCHGTTASGNTTISTPANHVNGKVDVSFSSGIWGGTYPTSGHAPGVDTSRTCSSTYCHSNGQTGAGQVFLNMTGSKTWFGTSASLGCSRCHGSTSSSTLLSGKHGAHLSTTVNPSLGTAFVCNDCHANGGTSNNRINHVNKLINYSGAKAGKITGVSPINCANFYCHSNGKGGYKSMAAAGWSSATTLNCNGCHGSEPAQPLLAAGAPNYVSGNSHAKHVTVATDCYKCHKTTTVDGVNIITGTTAHIDTKIDVRFAKVFNNLSGVYNSNKTCSNTYCHGGGNTTVAWGTVGSINCTSCHPNLGGAHARHTGGLNIATLPFYQYTSNKSAGTDTGLVAANYAFGCANCHPVDPAKHIDGFVEVELYNIAGQVSTLRAKNTVAAVANGAIGTNIVTCASVYCHGDGKGAWPVAQTMQWGQTYALALVDRCAQCHGNSPTTTGAHAAHVVGIHSDDIFNGTSGKLSAGTGGAVSVAHGDPLQATTLNCDICHYTTFDTLTIGRNYKNSSCSTAGCHPTGTDTTATQGPRLNIANHVNGSVLVSFKSVQFISKAQLRPGSFVSYTGGVAGWKRNQLATVDQYKTGPAAFDKAKNPLTIINWNSVTKSCSNVVCHNMKSGQSVLWTDSLTCDSCHSSL